MNQSIPGIPDSCQVGAGQARGHCPYMLEFRIKIHRPLIRVCERLEFAIHNHSHPIGVDWTTRNLGFMGNWNPETNYVEKQNVSGAGT